MSALTAVRRVRQTLTLMKSAFLFLGGICCEALRVYKLKRRFGGSASLRCRTRAGLCARAAAAELATAQPTRVLLASLFACRANAHATNGSRAHSHSHTHTLSGESWISRSSATRDLAVAPCFQWGEHLSTSQPRPGVNHILLVCLVSQMQRSGATSSHPRRSSSLSMCGARARA